MAAPLSHQTQCLQCQKMCNDDDAVICDLCRSACCSQRCRKQHRQGSVSTSFCDKRHLLLSFYEANSMLLVMLARYLFVAPEMQAVAILLRGDDDEGNLLAQPRWWPLSLEDYTAKDKTAREGTQTMRSRGYPDAFNVLVELGGIQENFDFDLAHGEAEGGLLRRHSFLRRLPFGLADSDKLFVSAPDIRANMRAHPSWFKMSEKLRWTKRASAPAGYITNATKAQAAQLSLDLTPGSVFYRESLYACFHEWVAFIESGLMTKDGVLVKQPDEATSSAEKPPGDSEPQTPNAGPVPK